MCSEVFVWYLSLYFANLLYYLLSLTHIYYQTPNDSNVPLEQNEKTQINFAEWCYVIKICKAQGVLSCTKTFLKIIFICVFCVFISLILSTIEPILFIVVVKGT